VSEKIKTVHCNLYSLVYMAGESYGRFRRTFRVLAMDVEDAMQYCTKLDKLRHDNSRCVAATLLAENVILRVSGTVGDILSSGDEHPYTDTDYRKMLQIEESGR
jgi:hypothetical protein